MVAKVTIRDISKEAGTSPSTVSRVLTGSAKVSPKKRQAVETAIQRLNYRPSQIARSLKTRVTYSVGLLLNDITNPFYSTIARGAEEVANQRGYSLILCNTNEDPERERQYLQVLHDKRVDGVILGPTGDNQQLIRDFAQSTPVVQVDRRLTDAPIPAVLTNNDEGAYRATRLLIDRGHRRIAVVKWRLTIMTMAQRCAGYERALRQAHIPLDSSLVVAVPGLTSDHVFQSVMALLQCDNPPTAIFALNNQIGLGVISAVQKRSLKVPDEIALIIFDDLPLFGLLTPSISAVAQPSFLMGERAMQLLIRQMENPSVRLDEVDVLPTELILRESV
jgi:LacI family transcriptional regulator